MKKKTKQPKVKPKEPRIMNLEHFEHIDPSYEVEKIRFHVYRESLKLARKRKVNYVI